MTKEQKKQKYCINCRDNYYNGIGADECWCLESSKVVWKKFVHINDRPPWNQKAERTLDCCHRDHYVCVKPEITC